MSTQTESPQQFSFQAEIKQLLHLLSHSLYQSREIAVRELISNASDALDKFRYISLTEPQYQDSSALEIVVEGDKEAGTLVIRDNGIGMTRDELIGQLGTIAHSGSLEFLKSLSSSRADSDSESGQADQALSLIGQFGVGFYSAFMLAEKVEVFSRSYKGTESWRWISEGTGTYEVEPVNEELPRGTRIVLHLREDQRVLADPSRIRHVITRYSSFVPHPIKVEDQVVNDQKPIWVEPKSQVTDEQYRQFYQHLTHRTGEDPLWHLHLSVDSPFQFHAIVYCPASNIERFGLGRHEQGLSLCAKRILVQSDCREVLPDYLRFLHGLVDSEDLPLNVSRESLQDSRVFQKICASLTKHVLDRIAQLADEDAEKYREFYDQFGAILREGVPNDLPNRERIARLLRFPSSQTVENGGPMTGLDAYIERLEAQAKTKPEDASTKPDPANAGDEETSDSKTKRIYYSSGPDLGAIAKSPNLEVFQRNKLEVLYLVDPVDEFVLSMLGEYRGYTINSVDSADLDLPDDAETPDAKEKPEPAAGPGVEKVIGLFKDALGDRVNEVRVSKRLTDSPCCLVNADGGPSVQMQKLLKLANQEVPAPRKILEINPSSALIKRLATLTASNTHDDFIKTCGQQLWANALALEGLFSEPEQQVARVQQLMEELAEKRSPILT